MRIRELAAEMLAAAVEWEPQGMTGWGRDAESFGGTLGDVAATFRMVAEKSAELPLDVAIKEQLAEVPGMVMVASEAVGEVPGSFRVLHPGDLARHESPRPGEQEWDTSRNDA